MKDLLLKNYRLAITKSDNSHLHTAREAKNDEFYTLAEDIVEELSYYVEQLKGHAVYCNCDDPRWSQFWAVLHANFANIGLTCLTATFYSEDEQPFKAVYTGGEDTNIGLYNKKQLNGNGDYASEECLAVLKEDNIVITNPPFSIQAEYMDHLYENNKLFLVVGANTLGKQKKQFERIKNGELNYGYTRLSGFTTDNDDEDMKHVTANWYTNMELLYKEPYTPELSETYSAKNYPKYDDYNAIEVSSANKIPKDYYGLMGVPITYLTRGDYYKNTLFDMLDLIAPHLNGKALFNRVLIKRKTTKEKKGVSHTPKINKQLSNATEQYGRPTPEELAKINAISKQALTADEVFTFNIRLADNLEDRVHDKMTDEFLNQFAELAVQKALTGLKDHDWSVDNQWSRVYDAEIISTGEGEEKYIKAKAFTLSTNADIIEKIKTGIISEVSTSFESESHCSICGEEMEKDYNDIGHCKNGHMAGQTYDGKKCYCLLDKCKDAFEFSIVSVPCQPNARIIKGLNGMPDATKNKVKTIIGGKAMTKKTYAAKRLLSILKKSQEQPDEELNDLLTTISDETAGDEEMNLEDIDKLLQEIDTLKARIKELEEQVKACEAKAAEQAKQAEEAAIDTVVDTEIEKLAPQTEQIKKCMKRDIDRTALKFENGQLVGLSEQLEAIKKDYEGLYGKKEPTPSPEDKQDKSLPSISFGKAKNTAVRKSFNEACATSK